jgi:hypothetical protein
VVTIIVVSLCGGAAAEQTHKDWYVALRLGFQPYTMEASGNVGNREFDAKADLSDILDNTDTTIVGGEVEFGKGKWFMILNGFYQKSEADKGDSTLGSTVTFKEMGFNPMVGYRVYQQGMGGEQDLSIDVMAGAYYFKMSADVEIYGPRGNVVSRDNDIDFLDPMVGVRAYYAFTKKFGVSVFGEIGGGGSELQYVASANLIYNFTDWFAMSAGYKYWYFKYEDDDKPLNQLEQKLYGPVIGLQFKF